MKEINGALNLNQRHPRVAHELNQAVNVDYLASVGDFFGRPRAAVSPLSDWKPRRNHLGDTAPEKAADSRLGLALYRSNDFGE